jgi:hypothetical protein
MFLSVGGYPVTPKASEEACSNSQSACVRGQPCMLVQVGEPASGAARGVPFCKLQDWWEILPKGQP